MALRSLNLHLKKIIFLELNPAFRCIFLFFSEKAKDKKDADSIRAKKTHYYEKTDFTQRQGRLHRRSSTR